MKNAAENKTRFCIIDNSKLTILLTDDKEVHPSYDLAVWLESPILGETLSKTIN